MSKCNELKPDDAVVLRMIERDHPSLVGKYRYDCKVFGLLESAENWISHAPHGDNCFVSDNYKGDPGNQCNCGKDSILAALDAAHSTESGA